MLQSDQRARESKRLSGAAKEDKAKLPTYQDLLDEALDDTFPASDPIAASAATRTSSPKPSRRDTHDWCLEPERQAGAADAAGRSRSSR